MTTIELRNIKQEMIKANKKHPCMYSIDDIRQRADLADQAIPDYRNGGKTRFITQEEMMKRIY